MRAGALRRVVEVQERQVGSDTVTWESLGNLSAQIVDQKGADLTKTTYQVNVRYFAGLAPGWRLISEGRKLNVLNVQNPDGRKAQMTLLCEQWLFAHTVRLEQAVESRSPSGAVTITGWETVFDGIGAARTMTASGDEVRRPDEVAELTRRTWILDGWLPDVTDKMRLIDHEADEVIWDITSVLPDSVANITTVGTRRLLPAAVLGR